MSRSSKRSKVDGSRGHHRALKAILARLRSDKRTAMWKLEVFEEGAGVCAHCGVEDADGARLQVHHILPISDYVRFYNITTAAKLKAFEEEIFSVHNGLLLCGHCHEELHFQIASDRDFRKAYYGRRLGEEDDIALDRKRGRGTFDDPKRRHRATTEEIIGGDEGLQAAPVASARTKCNFFQKILAKVGIC